MPLPSQEGLRPEVELKPHQERLVQRALATGGSVVAAHGVGTGKTIGSMAVFDRLRQRGQATKALVVVPAGLKKNYADAVQKFTTFSHQIIGPRGDKEGVYFDSIDPKKTYTIVSYDMFRRDPVGIMKATGADTLVFDEYHKARDPGGSTYRAGVAARAHARNFIGLTGSIVNNDPVEVVPLINLAANQRLMSPTEFNSRYKRRYAKVRGFFGGAQYLTTMTNTEDLKQRLGKYVDYISSEEAGKDMPRREVHEFKVPMSPEQQAIYDFTMKKVSPMTAWKIKNNLPVDQKEAFHIFSMIQQARQAANTIGPFVKDLPLAQAAERSPKMRRLLDDAEAHLHSTPDGQIVMYSNLIKGGIDGLSAGLKGRGIDHAIFVGKGREIDGEKITSDIRNQGVQDFLAGKKKVIVVSPAGAEGLDLRNSTLFQSLDGHFNPERTRQAEARARRLGGLSHRPEEQRKVEIRRYFSVYPQPGFFGKMMGRKPQATTDEWVHSVALQKHRLNEQLLSAFKQPSLLRAQKPPASQPVAQPAPMPPQPKSFQPTGYIRRWRDPITNEWRYQYPKTQGS